MVLGELQEARGNVESLRRRVKKWSAKLAECRRRGDLTGGGHAGERVLEGNWRGREAQKAVEVLERELQGVGGGVQVKHEGGVNDDDIVELGEVVVDEKDEERRANPGVKREEEEGGGRGMGMGTGMGMGSGRGHARAGMPPRKHVHMANRAQKCTWLTCRCIVPATFQTGCSGDVPICHQKALEKSFERRRNSLLERRWNTHPGYPPCRWRTFRSTLRTRAPFG